MSQESATCVDDPSRLFGVDDPNLLFGENLSTSDEAPHEAAFKSSPEFVADGFGDDPNQLFGDNFSSVHANVAFADAASSASHGEISSEMDGMVFFNKKKRNFPEQTEEDKEKIEKILSECDFEYVRTQSAMERVAAELSKCSILAVDCEVCIFFLYGPKTLCLVLYGFGETRLDSIINRD